MAGSRGRLRKPVNGKFTSEAAEKIIAALKAGNYLATAAGYAGVSRQTVYSWVKKGEARESPALARFAADVQEADAQAESRMVALINQAAVEQWQAAAWWLERRFPDRWGRRDHVTLAGDDGKPPVFVVRWSDVE